MQAAVLSGLFCVNSKGEIRHYPNVHFYVDLNGEDILTDQDGNILYRYKPSNDDDNTIPY